MNKVLIALLIICLFLISGCVQKEISDNTKNYSSETKNLEIEDKFSDIKEIHFTKMPITYSLNIHGEKEENASYNVTYNTTADNNDEIKRIRKALDIIESGTDGLITFKEIDEESNPDIVIYGMPLPITYKAEESRILNQTENKILKSKVIFYSLSLFEESNFILGRCADFPVTELHEILHSFGFGHIYDESNKIMYPMSYNSEYKYPRSYDIEYKDINNPNNTYNPNLGLIFRVKNNVQLCSLTEIDEETLSCLKKIYSDGKVEGDCSKTNIFPFSISKEEVEKHENLSKLENFKWDHLPISYSVFDCSDSEKNAIYKSIKKIEDKTNMTLLLTNNNTKSDINIYCRKNYESIILSFDTDTGTGGIPMGLTEYNFENEKIKEVTIYLWNTDVDTCGNGFELHELLHSLGLRKEYGDWMTSTKIIICSSAMVGGGEGIEKLKEIYSNK